MRRARPAPLRHSLRIAALRAAALPRAPGAVAENADSAEAPGPDGAAKCAGFAAFDLAPMSATPDDPHPLTHLQRLEAESIHIIREVVAECERPVMLYSIGKDSATMLHLARKAFHPAPPPFALLHVDTTWKFRDMYALRDRMARESGMELLVWRNPEALAQGINPFDHGS